MFKDKGSYQRLMWALMFSVVTGNPFFFLSSSFFCSPGILYCIATGGRLYHFWVLIGWYQCHVFFIPIGWSFSKTEQCKGSGKSTCCSEPWGSINSAREAAKFCDLSIKPAAPLWRLSSRGGLSEVWKLGTHCPCQENYHLIYQQAKW